MQERPISARPGKIKKINLGPGPQDYNLVDPKIYKRRSRVIPMISFGFPRAKKSAGVSLSSITLNNLFVNLV